MENSSASSLAWLDQWLARTWTGAPAEYQWLLLQTAATAASRRAWVESWPIEPGSRVVDLGCGPGIMVQEIASLKSALVMGLDRDSAVLDIAQSLNHLLGRQDSVKFRRSDILADAGEGTADLVVSRFVSQYVDDLAHFFRQARSHAVSGGWVAIEDIDDRYVIEHPEPPVPWQQAVQAFQQHQSGASGDRMVGRKLAETGVREGLLLESVSLNPAVFAGMLDRQDATVQFDIERIERTMPALIAQGLLNEDQWIEAKTAYRASFPHFSFVSTATVRVLFRVP